MELKESDMPSEREWKRYFRPKETLLTLGLSKGMVLADLGCGYGTFTIPAAEIVGERGLVYAVDIESKMVNRIEKKAKQRGLRNIKAIVGDMMALDKLDLPAGSMDIALLANVIHGTTEKIRLLKDVGRTLRHGGRIAVLNWNVSETPRGPPIRMRPTPQDTIRYLVHAGYSNPIVREVAPYHYVVIAYHLFQKPTSC